MTTATQVTQANPAPPAGPRGRRRARSVTSLTPASGLGLGVALLWFSLLVLIPLTAVVVQASSGGWSGLHRLQGRNPAFSAAARVG